MHCIAHAKVVATCCLFLAGKAEETPKKCKDLIRTVRTLTNDTQFATFGVDPREEVMVIERVLLQVSRFFFCSIEICLFDNERSKAESLVLELGVTAQSKTNGATAKIRLTSTLK